MVADTATAPAVVIACAACSTSIAATEKSRKRAILTRNEDESLNGLEAQATRIAANVPARVQSVALLTAWTAISTDKHNVDWDPKKGVVAAANDATWNAAVDDLIEDIRRALPMEQQRLRLALVDEAMSVDAEGVS